MKQQASPLVPYNLAVLLVCGNANVETVFHLTGEGLPVEGGFFSHQLGLNVSGVGTNLTRALVALGSPVRFLTFAADDDAGQLVRASFPDVDTHFAPTLSTPQSLTLVRPDGRHTFYRDLKDTPQADAPFEEFRVALKDCAAALLTNIGWTREFLPVARAAGVPILTDVQDIHDLSHPYDAPYFAYADVLFLSAARLGDPSEVLRELAQLTPAKVIVAGLADKGALLLERGQDIHYQPALPVQAVHHGGAGDTLAAAFAHFSFTRGLPAREALRRSCAAAALKLRTSGSGKGHPGEDEVLQFAR